VAVKVATLLVLIQVLYWAKDESQMERLKARLIELYYENLFKVIISTLLLG
jgi:hypothetical protein